MPMSYVSPAATGTNNWTTQAIIDKAVDRLSRRGSVFGGLGMDKSGRDRLVKTTDIGGETRDISNTAVIQSKVINKGDEVRFNMISEFIGQPTFNAAPTREGAYPKLKGDRVFINMVNSPSYPFMAEMDQQRIADFLENLEPEYQQQIGWYMGDWVDFLAIEALLCGADRGNLKTADGGRGLTLWNAAAAGTVCSCKNTFVATAAGGAMVTWSNTRATYETAIGTAIYGMADTITRQFSLTYHNKMQNMIASTLRFPECEFMGKKLRAIAITDPWIIKRLLDRSGTWLTLLRDADIRGPENHAINRDQACIIDNILYIPMDWMRTFRVWATNDSGYPLKYGCAINYDPKTYIDLVENASNPSVAALYNCGIIYLGAKALLHAESQMVYGAGSDSKKGGRIWFTSTNPEHSVPGSWAAHMKVGFGRYEPYASDGTTEYTNNNSLVAWFYDPGPGMPGATA